MKLKWMYEEPISLWLFRLVPPATIQSHMLIRLPAVTKGKRTVCLRPTQCAALACSSSSVPGRTWAPLPTLEPSKNVEPEK